MKRPTPAQLAAMELRLCELAHPGWLADAGVWVEEEGEGVRRSLPAAAALSRWLVDRHALVPLGPPAFTRCWSYAVLGGHDAVATLRQQMTAYCTARWVRSLVDGARLRLLIEAIGTAAYNDAIRRIEPANHWLPPARWPADVNGFLSAQVDGLMPGLWSRCAPALAPWVRLMAPPASDAERAAGSPPSAALVDEVDSLLQTDFAIDFDDGETADACTTSSDGDSARATDASAGRELSAFA